MKRWVNSSILSSPQKKAGLALASPSPIGSLINTMEKLRWKAPQGKGPSLLYGSPSHERKNMQTILIVDDDKSIRYSLKRMMEGKYSISTAQNGEEALDRLKQTPPDLHKHEIKKP